MIFGFFWIKNKKNLERRTIFCDFTASNSYKITRQEKKTNFFLKSIENKIKIINLHA
jgi:hypothetical protein